MHRHVSLVWFFAGYLWNLYEPVYVPCELFVFLGMSVGVYLCISDLFFIVFPFLFAGTVLRFLAFVLWGVILATTVFLEICFTCVMIVCLIIIYFTCTCACPSVSCKLWAFFMATICTSTLTQVTHV